MCNQTDIDYYKQLGLYRASVLIWKIVPPILILLGTIWNSLFILILTRRSIRVSTTVLFLTVLACSDLLVLYSGLLRQWLIYLFNTDVRNISEAGCKINMWMVYSSLDFSAWTLIIVTFDRVVSAWLPYRVRTVCTKKTAVAVLLAVGVFILAINAHMLYGMVYHIENDTNINPIEDKCSTSDQSYTYFFRNVWPWIDMCVFCIIPFVVIVIGNVLILFKVLNSHKKANVTVAPTNSHRARDQQQAIRNAKQSSMTAMLFTLNIVFLVTTLPVSIYLIGRYAYWTKGADDATKAKLDFWWAVVNMLMYTNNSLNFLLYCLSGTKFRSEFIRLITRKKVSPMSDFNLAQNNYLRTDFNNQSHTPTASPSYSPNLQNSTAISRRNNDVRQYQNTSPNHLHPKTVLKQANHKVGSRTTTTDIEHLSSDVEVLYL
ncbi:hypothetical protein DPMN_090853 [Dreissena polymorpha]|uniref:G-protein coupled receptors family 1 profile domain-containing protein n=1 Tax=Dreissena polymorpha TaxID=45954 RepID=A0A9D4L0Z6_DREPO|nr:hypothetical protein DPMN_090853 [Dreissena polymorpha]